VTPASRILVVDDDPTIRDVLSRYLAHAGFAVHTAEDGLQALASMAENSPDLVVLDVMLPGLDGIEVCRRLRASTPVPVVMLTALGEEDDRVVGLEVGADDYLTKPFSPRELVARIQAVLRRSQLPLHHPVPGPDLVDAGLAVDTAAHEVRLDGATLSLTTREYDLLVHLMTHAGTVFTREELLRDVWGWDFGDRSTVTVHVRRLREKLGEGTGGSRIVTVYGVGYRWRTELVR
jgi:DNA-binding response OmpR family regulator